ncbi:MAG: hypothetical protein VW555_04470, partial [Luminiphilus sp.]
LLNHYGKVNISNQDKKEAITLLKFDKKNSHGQIKYVLLERIGKAVFDIQIKDNDRFLQSARHGKQFGFGGKLCIHPDQIPLTHQIFTPSEEEIAHARAVVAAFEAAEAEGSASIQLDGYFIDYPIVYKSQRILALADQLLG